VTKKQSKPIVSSLSTLAMTAEDADDVRFRRDQIVRAKRQPNTSGAAAATPATKTPAAAPTTQAKRKDRSRKNTKNSKNSKNSKANKGTSTSTATLPAVLSCGVWLVQRVPFPAVLALLRHDGSPDLPKGHVKRGESDVAAALRELTEETGIPARSVRLDETFAFESTYRTRSKRTGLPVIKTVRLFLGEVDGPAKVTVSDHGDYAWLRLDDDDEALEQDLLGNPTFLGALRAWRSHEALMNQPLPRSASPRSAPPSSRPATQERP
jgi:8-oxo-dGTP pyrophosphatase MutT (NUDIX family)